MKKLTMPKYDIGDTVYFLDKDSDEKIWSIFIVTVSAILLYDAPEGPLFYYLKGASSSPLSDDIEHIQHESDLYPDLNSCYAALKKEISAGNL